MTTPIQAQARKGASAISSMFREKKIKGRLVTVERAPRYLTYHVSLHRPADLRAAVSIGEEVALGGGVDSVVIRRYRSKLYYDFNLPDESGLWQALNLVNTKDNIIGVGAGKRAVTIDFDDDTPNWLISGEPGSGKSVAIATALLSHCRRFTPDEFQFGLVDIHQDFYYSPFYKSAHLVCKPAVSNDEVSDLILWFHNQLRKRKGLGQTEFKKQYEAGSHPQLLLVLDESSRAEVLGTEKSPNKANLGLMVDLVQEGRKFKINTIVGTQKPLESDLPGIYSMLGARMVGYTNAVGHRLPVNPAALTKRGDFFKVTGVNVDRFLWAYPHRGDYEKILTYVEEYPAIEVDREFGQITIDDKPVGRPVTQLEPATLAAYMRDKPPSVRAAKDTLGLGYTLHKRYQKFAQDLQMEMKRDTS